MFVLFVLQYFFGASQLAPVPNAFYFPQLIFVFSEISLSKIHISGQLPPVFSRSIIFWYVSTIYSSVFFFIGSTNTVFPSISHMIMMYLWPLEDVMGGSRIQSTPTKQENSLSRLQGATSTSWSCERLMETKYWWNRWRIKRKNKWWRHTKKW